MVHSLKAAVAHAPGKFLHKPSAIAADVEILGRAADTLGGGKRRIEWRAVVGELDDDAMGLSAHGDGGVIGVAVFDGVEEHLLEAKTNRKLGLLAETQRA